MLNEPITDLEDVRANRVVERPEDYLSADELAFKAWEEQQEQQAATDAQVLDRVRAFHDAWGDTEARDMDPVRLWEDLGQILGVLP